MKILVIQQKMIGDVLISSIICDNLRTAYPDATIDYLVNETTTPVLEGNTSFDNLILFKQQHQKSFKELVKLALGIRRNKYDLIIDAYSKLQSWVIVGLSGAPRRISYEKPWRSFLYTDTVLQAELPSSNLGLAIERRLSLLEPLGLNIDLKLSPALFVSEKEKSFVEKLFADKHVDNSRKTVMISLLGSEEKKTYPLNYMAEIVDFIGKQYNVNILFNYFPKQITDAQIIYEACSRETKSKTYFDVLGSDLREFIAIMNSCDVIIGNDGGAINMAKALNKPSFIIFSPHIEKKIWATFEDGKKHVSVHLEDFEPELFVGKEYDYLKNNALSLYQKFVPSFIIPNLKIFLDRHSD